MKSQIKATREVEMNEETNKFDIGEWETIDGYGVNENVWRLKEVLDTNKFDVPISAIFTLK